MNGRCPLCDADIGPHTAYCSQCVLEHSEPDDDYWDETDHDAGEKSYEKWLDQIGGSR